MRKSYVTKNDSDTESTQTRKSTWRDKFQNIWITHFSSIQKYFFYSFLFSYRAIILDFLLIHEKASYHCPPERTHLFHSLPRKNSNFVLIIFHMNKKRFGMFIFSVRLLRSLLSYIRYGLYMQINSKRGFLYL